MVDRIFEQLDHWRHLPGYQLERRADIFFGCYLIEILEGQIQFENTGIKFHKTIIPEFPLHICGSKNLSNNVDYVAFSEDGLHAFLIELKTDESSFSLKQLEYLTQAKETAFVDIIDNIVRVFKASKTAKRKHFKLLEKLEDLGLVEISKEMKDIFDKPHGDLLKLRNLSDHDRNIRVLEDKMPQQIHIYYLKPKASFNLKLQPRVHELVNDHDVKVISFDDVKRTLENKSDDSFAKRFAQSLASWSSIKAGGKAVPKD